MKRVAVVVVLLSIVATLLIFPRVSAQVDSPNCDPTSLIAEIGQLKSANDRSADLQQLQQIDAKIQALMITCYGTPTPTGTPTLTPTLSRTDIAGTRAANQTATMASINATRTQQAANVQATRQQYYANLTETADAYQATATQRAVDRAATNAVYQITLTYIGPVRPTSAPEQPQGISAPQQPAVQPTETPAAQPIVAPVQPTQAPAAGNGATALCNDGTYSYAANHQGACSHHGGVKQFFK